MVRERKSTQSMIETRANLVVDLGNSQTRVITQMMGKTNKVKSRFSELPNRYAEVQHISEIPEAYRTHEGDGLSDDTSATYIFDHDDAIFTAGKYVERERGRDVIRPSSLEKKYNSLTTELAVKLALIEGYVSLAEIFDTSLGNLDVTWNVTVLIPPADIDLGAEVLSGKIKSITEITSHSPELSVKCNISDVKVLAEGFASFLGVLFNDEGRARKEYMHLAKSTTLIIDVGAGTTDYSLVKNAEPIDDMKDTVTIGGNNIVQTVRKHLRAKGITTTDDEIQTAVREGWIQDGAQRVSIVPELNEAKERVAKDIVNSIRDYFEYGSIPARSVEYLLVVGGGALNTVEGSRSVGEVLVEYFKGLSPNVELVKLPEAEGNLTARTLNVIGAGVVARRSLVA